MEALVHTLQFPVIQLMCTSLFIWTVIWLRHASSLIIWCELETKHSPKGVCVCVCARVCACTCVSKHRNSSIFYKQHLWITFSTIWCVYVLNIPSQDEVVNMITLKYLQNEDQSYHTPGIHSPISVCWLIWYYILYKLALLIMMRKLLTQRRVLIASSNRTNRSIITSF